MLTLLPTIDPVKSTPGIEGHGEGVKFGNHFYYYPRGRIPRNKVVTVKSESNFCGRVHGDVEYLVIAFNHNAFVVLEHHFGYGIKEVLAKYKGMTPCEAIEAALEEERKRQSVIDAMPKCRICGGTALQFEDDQPKNVCLTCYKGEKK